MGEIVPTDNTPPSSDSGSDAHPIQAPPPEDDVLRYRPGVAAVGVVILVALIASYAVRWADERFSPDKPVALVVCRGPEGGVETLPRGTTVEEALAGWGVDTAGIADTALKRRVPDGCRISILDTRAGRRVHIDELLPAERYALGLDFDINRASAPDLALIPGIGKASAKKVVAYRWAHGDFVSEEALSAVPGLGKDRARIIARYVSFGGTIDDGSEARDAAFRDGPRGANPPGRAAKLTKDDPPIDINRAGVEDLMTIPGVGEVTAGRIVQCRENNGPFETVADLERVEGIGKIKAQRIGEYVRF